MTIKSDKWIRRMAESEGLIEPFEAGQLRVDAAGQRIVSFGTSSYGYDVRCADEFKIFTNINSCLLYTSPSPRDLSTSRMPSSA